MAYSRRSRSTRRSAGRSRSTSRSGYRGRAVRSTARRSSGRRSSGGSRTIRIEVVGASPSAVARPEIGMKPAASKRTKMF